MLLNGKSIEQYFIDMENNHEKKDFPHGDNYCVKYKSISNELYKWVHSEVDLGSLSVDIINFPDKKTFLTHHGISHINTLIEKASLLISFPNCELSLFELFMLLMAIHFHDVGNILGRNNHEINARLLIEKMGTGVVNQDEWIWDYVFDIAKAHKGQSIATLADEDYLHDIKFRPQFLAAILKFADELSENFSRASVINLDIGNILDESALHHKYATCVNTITYRPISREIFIIYNLKEDDLKLQYEKNNKMIFLLDELYLRTLKTYREKVYCIKYLKPSIDIDSIKVAINIKMQNGLKESIGYTLRETISGESMEEFLMINPEMKEHTGEKWYKKVTT